MAGPDTNNFAIRGFKRTGDSGFEISPAPPGLPFRISGFIEAL